MTPRRSVRVLICVVAGSALSAAVATAQPFTLDQKIKPVEWKLQPYHGANGRADGRIYGGEITQTEDARYFFVAGISIYAPVYVAIASEDGTHLKTTLHKEVWDKANRSGETDSSGRWDAKFKTSGDFGIKIAPDKLPAKYAVLVWVGNEVDPPFASPFKLTTKLSSPGVAGSHNQLLYAIIALLVVALVVVLFVKTKPAKIALLIGALALSPMLARTMHAQGDYGKAVGELLDQLKDFLEHQESVEQFWESLKTLSSDEATPDLSQTGPGLPSSCLGAAWTIPPEERAIGSNHYQDCQCMTTAVDKLRRNRQMLEKLRILVANQKNFVDKATALGNSFAQLHTVLGLQWIGIRKHDIEEPYAQFKQISNQKHQALMDAIQKDLKDIGECEAKFGEADWYQKFGFIYYEFLYSAYKPSF